MSGPNLRELFDFPFWRGVSIGLALLNILAIRNSVWYGFFDDYLVPLNVAYLAYCAGRLINSNDDRERTNGLMLIIASLAAFLYTSSGVQPDKEVQESVMLMLYGLTTLGILVSIVRFGRHSRLDGAQSRQLADLHSLDLTLRSFSEQERYAYWNASKEKVHAIWDRRKLEEEASQAKLDNSDPAGYL